MTVVSGVNRSPTPVGVVAASAALLIGLKIAFNHLDKTAISASPSSSGSIALMQCVFRVLIDSIILVAQGNRVASPRQFAKDYGPNALTVLVKKVSRVASLGTISLPLANVVSSSGSVLTALVEFALFGKLLSRGAFVGISLISFGVAAASTGELDFNLLGFSLAVISAFSSIVNNILLKRSLMSSDYSMMEVHFHLGLASLIVFLPFHLLLSSEFLPPASILPRVCVSATILTVASLISYVVRRAVENTTYALLQCLQLLVVVVVQSVLIESGSVSAVQFCGVALTAAGVFLYARAKNPRPSGNTK